MIARVKERTVRLSSQRRDQAFSSPDRGALFYVEVTSSHLACLKPYSYLW